MRGYRLCWLLMAGSLQGTSYARRHGHLKNVLEMPGYGFTLSIWVCGQHQAPDGVLLECLLDPVQPHLSLIVNAPGHAEVVGGVHRSSFCIQVSDVTLTFHNLYRDVLGLGADVHPAWMSCL